VWSSLAKIYVLLNICTSSCISATEHTKQRWYLDFRPSSILPSENLSVRIADLRNVRSEHPPADVWVCVTVMWVKVPKSLGADVQISVIDSRLLRLLD
jgi:hypothetical protein